MGQAGTGYFFRLRGYGKSSLPPLFLVFSDFPMQYYTMLNMKSKGAFTLIEILIVLLVIGIIAVIAAPKLLDIAQQANNAAEQGTIRAIEEGIRLNTALEMTGS